MSIQTAGDHAARLIRSGTHPSDAAHIAAGQSGVDVRAVFAELARRRGAKRRTIRKITRSPDLEMLIAKRKASAWCAVR